jgi:hypothetical protein
MSKKTTTILIMAARLCGIVALALGVIHWAGTYIPLHIHMAFGGLLVLCLWGLAIQGRSRVTVLALVACLWGALVPVVGMMQLHLPLGDEQWLLQAFHALGGIGAIALAEMLAKRLRRS